MRSEFTTAMLAHQDAFGLDLRHEQIERLANYYEFVQDHNPLLHLVGPSTAEEFAVRHILESLTLLAHLPQGSKFADVGAGAGLPSIPCLLVRDDLKAVLIESKEKKAAFLDEALTRLRLGDRTTVINKQYAEAEPGECTLITCRALDKFTDKLPHLIRWARRRTLLLFGGPNLEAQIRGLGYVPEKKLMPGSNQRYLFVISSPVG